jgi:hypothetical protein
VQLAEGSPIRAVGEGSGAGVGASVGGGRLGVARGVGDPPGRVGAGAGEAVMAGEWLSVGGWPEQPVASTAASNALRNAEAATLLSISGRFGLQLAGQLLGPAESRPDCLREDGPQAARFELVQGGGAGAAGRGDHVAQLGRVQAA